MQVLALFILHNAACFSWFPQEIHMQIYKEWLTTRIKIMNDFLQGTPVVIIIIIIILYFFSVAVVSLL